jgi:hypothetical protein
MKLSTVAAVFALLAVPAIAAAHGGNDDPNAIHACINNASKSVRIVGVTGSCSTAETPAHWGIHGTNGTNGIDGTSVTFVGYFSGNQNGCPNGGAIYSAGNPPANAYVCNGASGATVMPADGPCFDNTNRYVDCGNGTVTDTETGLIWLKQSDCLGAKDWAAANQAAAALKSGDCSSTANPLSDGSSAGDWRLPTRDEWIATVADAKALGCTASAGKDPSLTNDAGTGCLSEGPPSFSGVASNFYWSSTSHGVAIHAWSMTLSSGFVLADAIKEINALRVWPVRGGAR